MTTTVFISYPRHDAAVKGTGDNFTARVLEIADGGAVVARLHADNLIEAVAFSGNSQEVAIAGLHSGIDHTQ